MVKSTEGSGEESASYSDIVTYLKNKIVFHDKQTNEEFVLNVGKHEFPFSFELPDKIPTSFEAYNAQILYCIVGVIDKKLSLDCHTYTSFTVINKHNLNIIPGVHLPTSVNQRKVFCCGFCKSDPVEITFAIQKSNIKKSLLNF